MVTAAFLLNSSRINYFNLDFIQDSHTCGCFSSSSSPRVFARYNPLSPDAEPSGLQKSCKLSQLSILGHHTIMKG